MAKVLCLALPGILHAAQAHDKLHVVSGLEVGLSTVVLFSEWVGSGVLGGLGVTKTGVDMRRPMRLKQNIALLLENT